MPTPASTPRSNARIFQARLNQTTDTPKFGATKRSPFPSTAQQNDGPKFGATKRLSFPSTPQPNVRAFPSTAYTNLLTLPTYGKEKPRTASPFRRFMEIAVCAFLYVAECRHAVLVRRSPGIYMRYSFPGMRTKRSLAGMLLCRFFFVFFPVRMAGMTACATRTTAAVAAATVFSLFSADNRSYDDRGNDRTCGDNDKNFIPDHFLSSRDAAASDCRASSSALRAAPCVMSGCLLSHRKIPKIAAAMRTAKIKHVHHHEPMR